MPDENEQVIRSFHAAFNRDGLEAALPYLDPEVKWHDMPDQPEATVHHGHEGVRQAFRVFLEPFAEFTVELEEVTDLGDRVLFVDRLRGLGVESGAEVTQDVFSVWTLRARKVVDARFFRSRAEALEAAGLQE